MRAYGICLSKFIVALIDVFLFSCLFHTES
jgi:hypothetical protein